jgi:type III restriction enzyme
MRLKFDATLDYQRQAIDAVTSLFDGQPIGNNTFSVALQTDAGLFRDLGVGNELRITADELLANLQRVQERNGLPRSGVRGGLRHSLRQGTARGVLEAREPRRSGEAARAIGNEASARIWER